MLTGAAPKRRVAVRSRWWYRKALFRERLAILFCPVAVCGDGLHWGSALSATGARTLHFGFGHASAGLGLKTSTDINSLFPVLVGLLSFTGVRGYERQQKQQD